MTIDFESSITEFLELGRRLQAAGPITGRRVLEELTAWYRDRRIEGALVDEDGDMLLLQWGKSRQLMLSEPTDLRGIGDGKLKYGRREVKYLDFRRQVFPSGGDEDVEFDDEAVQMSIMLGFGPADGGEVGANRWIHTPDEIDEGKGAFLEAPFVKALLDVPAKSVCVTVGLIG